MNKTLKDAWAHLTGRDLVWAVIREVREEWTIADLSIKTGTSESTIRNYVMGLERAGIVTCTGEREVPNYRRKSQLKRKIYALVRDCGVDAPRVRKDGTMFPPTGRERMWRALRILNEFTVTEILAAASQGGPDIAESEARRYCDTLVLGGYLRRIRPGRYRFIPARNTGGRAPQILRVKKLLDMNTGEIAWESKPRGENDA